MDTLVIDSGLAPKGLRGQFLEMENSFGGDVYTVHHDGSLVRSWLDASGVVRSEVCNINEAIDAAITVGMPYEPVRLTYHLTFENGKLKSVCETDRRELYAMA